MEWRDIISIVLSVLSLLGVGVVMKHFWDDRHAKKLAETEEQKNLRKRQRQDEIREVVKEELSTLSANVTTMLEQSKKDAKGTLTILRCQMKQLLDDCRAQGFASGSDKANYNELYNTYGELGGNHFKEYVDQWKAEMEGLPDHKE